VPTATSLTTRQRDLYRLLLRAKTPLPRSELTRALGLTTRQTSYALTALAGQILAKGIRLEHSQRAGISLSCTPEQRKAALHELDNSASIQLVLAHEHRQGLFTLLLLCTDQPLTLGNLQARAGVSRTTVIKDLEVSAAWLAGFGVQLRSKPNVGVQCQAEEAQLRQALCALLWQISAQPAPLIRLTHTEGLVLDRESDRALLPLLADVFALLRKLDTRMALALVANAEAELGGRYVDDGVLYLALTFAVQGMRMAQAQPISLAAPMVKLISVTQAWSAAQELAQRLAWQQRAEANQMETAWACAHLLCAPRNERWRNDALTDLGNARLISSLAETAAEHADCPRLMRDPVFRDGLTNVVVPACLRQRFGLAQSPLQHDDPGQLESHEQRATDAVVTHIRREVGIALPAADAASIALLIRAALTREQQTKRREVIVVCPSGMATAQLLVARLKVYFPRFRDCRVVSLRELNNVQFEPRQLVISTLPLPEHICKRATVIQVSPLLAPADVERITRALP
jgi:mannitol operon transcriptional antiterminator